ncbi:MULTISPECIES: YbaB/EbfC family DNA-binding protein [unclassified Mycolicibacterium]|uniref:YbaB/EbfC family DNA-binding protein n=1 Tax=unclassified Mycolicibacterium TaxID=2636767 RepID=UPI00130CDA46|nr:MULTISPECIES: YbaB/EbfC family DNA-binding protein [unclassified Mycolicibacterium]MUL82863.1 YbaB/EbfC family DNA-binding protein [Mycolicibacterium sp. CBMA 329]MUL89198.1 YbaB/EbfC family DNA-binding protein [Mycolicibacterium sp. CBMA 331]MUL97765.1 YbaB/EbfC family DNA-binding protein [Mycolicibacterium sp. CBMA 334]MUM25122.1 YbaB/EbfC family DNA-binding protein [Mycolicibacterium sp. CBMA 295]MUM38714.1 YbaB/EbfC family DNA-binding protein [Mycolicibacterium sp. CBMA 247]
MGDFPPHYPDDDDNDDDLSALDFSYPDDGLDAAALDALGTYEDSAASDDAVSDDGWDGSDDEDENLAVPLFTVTNPPETVTVTAFMDGRVHQIELAPRVANLTERDLAEEILVIAGLAAQQAKSAQYSFMLAGMREHGHDDAATRDFLTRDLDLLTPEQADDARAQVFSTRYGGDHG